MWRTLEIDVLFARFRVLGDFYRNEPKVSMEETKDAFTESIPYSESMFGEYGIILE